MPMWMAIVIRRLMEAAICFVVAMFAQFSVVTRVMRQNPEAITAFDNLVTWLIVPGFCAVIGPFVWDYYFHRDIRTGR